MAISEPRKGAWAEMKVMMISVKRSL
jgi:hypothetical protein